jgi:hypothetical protein
MSSDKKHVYSDYSDMTGQPDHPSIKSHDGPATTPELPRTGADDFLDALSDAASAAADEDGE